MAVGAIIGVLAAAAGKRRKDQDDDGPGRAYLSSFRYVLEGDSDGAIEELSRRSADQPDTLATSFALGSLFRRKGDLVRAIRLHEAMLETPGLSPEWRRSVEYELGVDFRRLGMFSRAIASLEKVVEEVPDHREALRELREICEEIGDWERAAHHQTQLEQLGASAPSLSAHLHAGHARKLLAELRLDEADQALERAFAASPTSADAFVAKAEVALARGDGKSAVAALEEALELRPEALPAIFPLLEAAFIAQSAYADLGPFLEARLHLNPDDPSMRLALARHLRRRRLVPEAAAELRKVLQDHPQLGEARLELGELLLDGAIPGDHRIERRALLKGPGNPLRPFACGDCGMELTQFFFRCPRCFAWDTIARAEGTANWGGKDLPEHGISPASPQVDAVPGWSGPTEREDHESRAETTAPGK